MDDNEGKEFAGLGVKTWLIKQLSTLGVYALILIELDEILFILFHIS